MVCENQQFFEAGDEDAVDTPVLELGQHLKPELRALAPNILLTK
jgi:hypothetical protein